MDRRRFLLTSLAGVLAASLVAEAQPAGKVARVGQRAPSPNRRSYFPVRFGHGPAAVLADGPLGNMPECAVIR
jgi:hypothetical protein